MKSGNNFNRPVVKILVNFGKLSEFWQHAHEIISLFHWSPFDYTIIQYTNKIYLPRYLEIIALPAPSYYSQQQKNHEKLMY